PAVTPDIETGWESGDTDPSNTQRTRGGLPLRTTLPGWRTLTVTPTLTDHDAALGGGLNGTDWQALRATLRADPYVLAAPLTLTPADRNRTGLYGLATKLPSIASAPGPNYQPAQLTIEEIPG
ncbi:MAG TPA: hypothetical protein VFN09_07585, partial [Rhodanobacteraceae bacterium]|nr:hypothetical protein [Rhodanobacteraceae bacterium]